MLFYSASSGWSVRSISDEVEDVVTVWKMGRVPGQIASFIGAASGDGLDELLADIQKDVRKKGGVFFLLIVGANPSKVERNVKLFVSRLGIRQVSGSFLVQAGDPPAPPMSRKPEKRKKRARSR